MNVWFDVIFIDYIMPEMNGAETAKILKKMMEMGEIPKIPIIGLTAMEDEDETRLCLEAGMVKVLKKPLEIDVLNDVFIDINFYGH